MTLRPISTRYRIDKGDAWVIVEIKLRKHGDNDPVWQMIIDDVAIENYGDHDDAVHEARVLAPKIARIKSLIKVAQDEHAELHGVMGKLMEPRRSDVELSLGIIAQEQTQKVS